MKPTSRVDLVLAKEEIENLLIARNDLQKSNRVQQSLLLNRESELCDRRHRILSVQLETNNQDEHRLRINREYYLAQTHVSNLRRELDLVKEALEQTLSEQDSLDRELSIHRSPDIKSISHHVRQHRENAKKIKRHLRKLPKVVELIDSQKQELESKISQKRDKLKQLEKRSSGLQAILRTPIDDLQLEQLAVESLESTILRELPNHCDESEASLSEEQTELENLENENRKRRERVRPSFISTKPQLSPLISKVRRHPATPSARRPEREEEIRFAMSQISENMDEFERRQSSIDQIERDTLTLRESYAEDQQQIESSWAYKMDDIKALQEQLDETENLMFEIDEMKDKLVDLHEQYDDVHSELVKQNRLHAAVVSRLDALSEVHPELVERVERLAEFKRAIAKRDRTLGKKRRVVESLESEVEDMYNNMIARESIIASLENQYKNIRNSEYSTQIATPVRERVKFINVNSARARNDNMTPVKKSPSSDSLMDQSEQSTQPVNLDWDDSGDDVVRIISDNDDEKERKQILFAAFPSPDDFVCDVHEPTGSAPETPRQRFLRTEYNSFDGTETVIPQRSPARISFVPLSPVRRGRLSMADDVKVVKHEESDSISDSLEKILHDSDQYSDENSGYSSAQESVPPDPSTEYDSGMNDSLEAILNDSNERYSISDSDPFKNYVNDNNEEEDVDSERLRAMAEEAIAMPLLQSKFYM